MKKTKKKELDYERIAVYVAIVVFAIATIVLIVKVKSSKKESVSEILEIGNIQKQDFKEKRAIITNYNDYKQFIKDNNLEKGNLKASDFKKNNYLLLIESYAKDVEYEMKKIKEISNSAEAGLTVKIDFYNYCDEVNSVDAIAYLIPIDKENTSKDTKIEVDYNNLTNETCE